MDGDGTWTEMGEMRQGRGLHKTKVLARISEEFVKCVFVMKLLTCVERLGAHT